MEGGFSIREYASRMRSINVVNCWPFDETLSEETIKSLLPPITVKKFVWWIDELEYMHSESAKNVHMSDKKKKKMQEKGKTSEKNEDQESDIDAEEGVEIVKVKSLKGKLKPPKKRSIVEIFAVAPPVERVISEEDDDDVEDSVQEDLPLHSSACHKYGKRKMKKKNRDVILRKALRLVKKIKKKKAQKREDEMGQSVPNKENYFKFKLQAQDKATGNPSSSNSEGLENDIRDCVSILKRKPRLQHLDAYKKTVPCNAFKLTEEDQHPGLPAHGILKNHGKAFSLKQSMKCILQDDVQVNHCSTPKADKRVTFSDKYEIQSRKPSHSTECLKLQKASGSDIDNVVLAGGTEKESNSLETSGSEDASIITGKKVGVGPASNKQLTTFIVDSTTFTKQNSEEECSRRSNASKRSSLNDMNQHWSDSGLRDEAHNPMDACPPGFFRMPPDGYYNSPSVKVTRNSSNSTCMRLNKDLGSPGLIFPPDCLRTYNETSASHLSNMEKRTYRLPQASSESTIMNNALSFQFQTFPQLSPEELMHTFCSLPEGGQPGNICGRRSINGINEEFVGLPLNSQGELITLNSSAKREVNQMMSSGVTTAHSISLSLPSNAISKFLGHHSEHRLLDCRASSMDQLNLFPAESYVKETPIAVIPSRLGISKSQSESKTNLDMDFLEINYHSFHDSEYTMCKGDNQDTPGNEKIQSTMRLMGKEFKVGGKGVEGLEDGHIWKDKQIIDELHFGNNSVSNVMHDQNEPSLGKLRETLFCPSEIKINHRSESKYALPHFDHQTSSMYPNVYVARKIDPVQKLYPTLSPGTSPEVYNRKSLFSEPNRSGYESQLFALELPTPTAAHQELCPNMSPSAIQLKNKQNPHPSMSPGAIQLKNKQNLHHSPISAIRFPFMHPDLDGCAKSSWARRSSVHRPPLCFDVSEKAKQLSIGQSCNLGRNHPYPKPGSSHGTDYSVSLQPGDFCMFSPLSSGSASKTSVGPDSLAPMSYYAGVLPVSAMPKRHGNQKKFKEGIKSRIGIKSLDNGKKYRGQLSALSNVPFKPLKKPTLGFHKDLQCAIRKPTACVSFEDSVNNMADAFGSCSVTNKSKFVRIDEHEANKDEQIIAPWVDSYTDTARTGPIKLTAGAKHILKACQQEDQNSSRSTEQDISLSATTIGFRFSESENSAKIYSFPGKAPVLEL